MRQHLQKEKDEMATAAFQKRYVMLSDRPLGEAGFISVWLIRDVRMRGMATDAFRAVITCTSLLSKRLLLGYSGQPGELRFHRIAWIIRRAPNYSTSSVALQRL